VSRPATRCAYSAWLVTLLCEVWFAVIGLADGYRSASDLLALVGASLAFQGMATIGVLIVRQDARNAIGWIFRAAPLGMIVGDLAGAYSEYALVHHPGLPGGVAAAVAGAAWQMGATLLVFLPLLFPDGRLPSRRWRWLGWLGGVSYAALCIGSLFSPGPFDPPLQRYANPIGIDFPGILKLLPLALVVIVAPLGIVALGVRYRRGARDERQQLKWLLAAVCATAAIVVASVVTQPLTGFAVPQFVVLVIGGLVPVSVGIAILRYRLYEIDVTIRRTLVYTTLVASLAVVYLTGVYLLDRALQAVTGQSGAFAVTLSTLAVAALFQRLRRRIQHGVDRRFYRAAYDAAATLDAFTSRLRDQIDLNALHTEVDDVINATVHPRHATLWIRPPEPSSASPTTSPRRHP
jgi:hypothetical protein